MSEHHIFAALRSARELIENGDQGDAQVLLTRALADCGAAADAEGAIAIAESTRLLVTLDAGIFPLRTLDAHVERMRRLTDGFAADDDVMAACVDTELCCVEWVHDADGLDPVVLVEVLHAALDLVERHGGSPDERVRRAVAEAAFTAQMIREWLSQDAASIAVALESLAVGLTGEADSRMRSIRIDALYAAARVRVTHDLDADSAVFLLRTVIAEAAAHPPARDRRYSASIRLADLLLDGGAPPREALDEAVVALHADAEDDAADVRVRCRHLEALLDRLAPGDRAVTAVEEWSHLIDRYAKAPDPHVRDAIFGRVLARRSDAGALTTVDVRILQHADSVARADLHPQTALARFRIAALLVEVLGHPAAATAATSASEDTPRRDATRAIRLSEEVEQRFSDAADDPELRVPLARLRLDRALRLSDLGHSEQSLALLTDIRSELGAVPADDLRHLAAQAEYWTSRLLREAGRSTEAREAVDSLVDRFAGDPDADVRVQAANALFSAWRDPAIDPAQADSLFARFTVAFEDDHDPRIRRHDASGRLNQAVRAHERGATAHATEMLRLLVERYADDEDTDIADSVRLARENLTVLSLSAASTTTASSAATSEYGGLRDRLYATDALYEAGRHEDAVNEWRALADATAGTNDPNIAVLHAAALDMWGGHLNDVQHWVELVDVARRAMIARGALDFRGEQMRARAYLRFGIAQGRLGDPGAAIQAYEALDGLIAAATSDELMTVRQQAVYNRAVLIDDFGDVAAAIDAYDHALAVHAASRDSPTRRLRRVKALRNKALLLDGVGRLAEAAGAHRQVLDIAAGAPSPELTERARLSAFALAECFARLGDHASAAQTYSWMRSAAYLGLGKADVRTAAQAQKAAEREARRARPLR
ncbi:MAG: hypothetical protein K0Q52_705 [Microbacterium sp.]|nr:hypothetical protein [Microbacterium sp.]